MDKELENLIYKEIDEHVLERRLASEVGMELKKLQGDNLVKAYDRAQEKMRKGEKVQVRSRSDPESLEPICRFCDAGRDPGL